MKVQTAMRLFAVTAIICDMLAVIASGNLAIGLLITVGVLMALMVGYTYIRATKEIVEKSGFKADEVEV